MPNVTSRVIALISACPLIGLIVAGPGPAAAHVTFETERAEQNSTQKVVLRVPHGCDGQPTDTLRIAIPGGVIAVKPMPKPGWKLETRSGDLARTYLLYGRDVRQGVKEIIWSGGQLADDQYDEFAFQARFTAELPAGETLYFPVTQECGSAKVAWTEIPERGRDAHGLKSPAPGIVIEAPKLAAMHDAAMHDHGAMAAMAKPGRAITAGAITVAAPWARATPAGAKTGGGYLRITNAGPAPDRLIGGSSEIAGAFEIHEMALESGVMRMRALETGLEIAPGATIELKPGGYHLMLIDLKAPLVEGGTVKGVLEFEKAGKIAVEYRIESRGATSSGEGDQSAHQHGQEAKP